MAEEKLRAAVIGGGLGGSHGYAYARAPEYESGGHLRHQSRRVSAIL